MMHETNVRLLYPILQNRNPDKWRLWGLTSMIHSMLNGF